MIRKAFILGAGLGTRLRPLTEQLPKPLVPLFHKPLAEWAMEACARAGAEEFAINTHHLPEAWRLENDRWARVDGPGTQGGNGLASRRGTWRGHPVEFFHEPELLETGGGIRNLAAWIAGEPVLVHNGDIFSSMPLDRLVEAHAKSGNLATLAVRSDGPARHLAIDDGLVIDIRHQLGRAEGTHLFTGVYVFSPGLLDFIGDGKISVIPAFLELARLGKLGAVVLDEGQWFDLGDLPSYLAAHRELALADPIHPQAEISPRAKVERSVVGPGATVGAGAEVVDSVVWPGARVAEGERLVSAVAWKS